MSSTKKLYDECFEMLCEELGRYPTHREVRAAVKMHLALDEVEEVNYDNIYEPLPWENDDVA